MEHKRQGKVGGIDFLLLDGEKLGQGMKFFSGRSCALTGICALHNFAHVPKGMIVFLVHQWQYELPGCTSLSEFT